MPGRFPLGKPKSPSWVLPVLALSLAVMAHAVWLLVPQPAISLRKPVKAIRLYAYPNLDTQAWSPTLFSLPSPLGFSGAIRQRTSNVIPPLTSPVVLNQTFPFNMEDVFPDPGMKSNPDNSTALPVMVDPSRAFPEEESRPFEWSFRASKGRSADFELTRLPDAPPHGKVMVVTGIILFDLNGQVMSLLFDSPDSLGQMRPQILRSLRRLRWLTGGKESLVRFRFEYTPVEAGL